jgi:S-DNA-T family DNA segregation ATPase FtsK/SpoIIIE
MVRKKTDNSKREESGFKFRYVFYIIVMLLLLLSIFSHAPEDFAVIQGGSDEPVKNWIGPVGAQISCLLFLLFGVTVYPLIIILVVCALRPFLDFPTKRRGYFGAFIAVVIGATILFAMWPGDFAYRTAKLGIGRADAPLSALSGGVVGQVLASPKSGEIPAGFIRRYIGSVGTVITALVFVLSGALWLADWKVVCVHLLNRNNGASKQTKSKTSVKVEPEEDEEEGEKKSGLWPFGKNKKDDQEEEIDEEDEEEEEEELPPVIALKPKRTEPMFDEEEEPAPPVSKIPKQSSQQKSYENSEYVLPPVTMLEKAPEGKGESDDAIQRSQEILQNTLESFSVDGKVSGIVTGPRVTRYEISLAPGVKVQKVEGIASNIAMELEAESIRILAPIPGKNAVGVEAPNSVASPVYLRAMMESSQWKKSNAEIPIVLGKDVSGKVVILDLAKAPHLLIAGATGSGKSVCMNTLIMSLLFRFAPSELRVIMVDPKVVEMEMYTPLPHLITPVVNDPHKVPLALRWAVNEMENRYRVLAKAKCRNLATREQFQANRKWIMTASLFRKKCRFW